MHNLLKYELCSKYTPSGHCLLYPLYISYSLLFVHFGFICSKKTKPFNLQFILLASLSSVRLKCNRFCSSLQSQVKNMMFSLHTTCDVIICLELRRLFPSGNSYISKLLLVEAPGSRGTSPVSYTNPHKSMNTTMNSSSSEMVSFMIVLTYILWQYLALLEILLYDR